MADATKMPEDAFPNKLKASGIGIKDSSGNLRDTALHEEILKGTDDSALRLRSAKQAVEKMGFTPEQAEKLFNVKLS
jgi:hypothetical protein